MEGPQPDGRQRLGATPGIRRREGEGGDAVQVPGQHGGPPHVRRRESAGLGHRVEHHPFEGALAETSGQRQAQEPVLGLGRPPEQLGQDRVPGADRPGPGRHRQAGHGTVDVGDGERRLRGRRRRKGGQRRPAHPDPALPGLAAQQRDSRRHLVGLQPPQKVGQGRHLGRARRRGGHPLRRRHELREERHRRSLCKKPSIWRFLAQSSVRRGVRLSPRLPSPATGPPPPSGAGTSSRASAAAW